MRGTKWSDDKVREALEGFALTGNIAATSREVCVPKSTVARWVSENAAEIERIRERNARIREQAIEQSVEEMARRHSQLGQRMQQRGEALLAQIRRPTAGAVATLIGRGVDIERLSSGQATTREEVSVLQRIMEAIEEQDDREAVG